MNWNISLLEQLISELANVGASSCTLAGLMPIGRAFQNLETLNLKEEERLSVIDQITLLRKKYEEKIPIRTIGIENTIVIPEHCEMAKSVIGIRADGALLPCLLSKEKNNDLPFLTENNILDSLALIKQKVCNGFFIRKCEANYDDS